MRPSIALGALLILAACQGASERSEVERETSDTNPREDTSTAVQREEPSLQDDALPLVDESETEDSDEIPIEDDDEDGWDCTVDCDDHDPDVHPSATEPCDGRDWDCDGSICMETPDPILRMNLPLAGAAELDGEPGIDLVLHDEGTERILVVPGALIDGRKLDEDDATAWTRSGEEFAASFAVQDLDVDGVSELLVGASAGDGAVYLYKTSPGSEPYATVHGAEGALGSELFAVGDLNGDLIPEFVAVAPDYSEAYSSIECVDTTAEGMISLVTYRTDPWYFLSGDVEGEALVTDLSLHTIYGQYRPSGCYYLATARGISTLSGDGDLDGDGLDDVVYIQWDWDHGDEYMVLHGGRLGMPDPLDYPARYSLSYERLQSDQDMNGDGYSDILLWSESESRTDEEDTAAVLWFGGPVVSAYETWILSWGPDEERFRGISSQMVMIPDHDGDGAAELVLGDPTSDDGSESAGTVHIFEGPISAGTATLADGHLWWNGPIEGAGLGSALVGVDADADGLGELLVFADGAGTLHLW